MTAGAALCLGPESEDSTRARLLDAATEVFLARGYDAMTLAEVTERADLGTGTLFLHFRDKRTLYEPRRARDRHVLAPTQTGSAQSGLKIGPAQRPRHLPSSRGQRIGRPIRILEQRCRT